MQTKVEPMQAAPSRLRQQRLNGVNFGATSLLRSSVWLVPSADCTSGATRDQYNAMLEQNKVAQEANELDREMFEVANRSWVVIKNPVLMGKITDDPVKVQVELLNSGHVPVEHFETKWVSVVSTDRIQVAGEPNERFTASLAPGDSMPYTIFISDKRFASKASSINDASLVWRMHGRVWYRDRFNATREPAQMDIQ